MRVLLSALVTTAALAPPQISHASTIDSFSLTGSGLTLSFSAPASPTPISTGSLLGIPLYFELGPLSFVENGLSHTLDDAYFYSASNFGGFALETKAGAVIGNLDFLGPQLFSGSLASPTFLTGTFPLSGFVNHDPYSLTISPVASTPEPASLLLLSTGALSTVGVLRRRGRQTT